MLTVKITIIRSEGIFQAEIDDKSVKASIQKGFYYALNVLVSRIWLLLELPKTVQAICEQLQMEYGVEGGNCKKEVFKFPNDMAVQKVIQLNV